MGGQVEFLVSVVSVLFWPFFPVCLLHRFIFRFLGPAQGCIVTDTHAYFTEDYTNFLKGLPFLFSLPLFSLLFFWFALLICCLF